jgi:hypothetical protein
MPSIRFTQNAVPGTPGVGYEGVISLPVTMNYEGGSGGALQWLIEDVAYLNTASALAVGSSSITNPTSNPATFTPDVKGLTVRVSCQEGALPKVYGLFAVNNDFGFRPPAAHSPGLEANFGGNTRGHAYEQEKMYRALEGTLVASPSIYLWMSDGAIAVNTLVKASAATDNRVVQVATSDDPGLIVGVALDAAAGAGVLIRVVGIFVPVQIKSDGSGTITRGTLVEMSTTVAGHVRQRVTGQSLGSAFTGAPATLGALVTVF